jgi:hypothetical protein
MAAMVLEESTRTVEIFHCLYIKTTTNGKKERNAIGWARKRNPRQIPSRA